MKQPFWLPFGPGPIITIAQRGAWDTLKLGGNVVPGEVKLTDEGAIAIKVDRQNAKGTKGNDFVQTGYDFAKFGILITLFTAEEWDAYQDFEATILPVQKARGVVAPQAIEHPALAAKGIDKCIIISVGIAKTGQLPQTKEVLIKCEQWAKVVPSKVVKPASAASKDKALRTIVTQREEQWRQQEQERLGTTLPADQIRPMPPSFARPGPDG